MFLYLSLIETEEDKIKFEAIFNNYKKTMYYIANSILKDVTFEGGCSGNLIGIKHLIEGKSIDEIIEDLEDIPCKNRGTSCPDQLAKALKIYKKYVLNKS